MSSSTTLQKPIHWGIILTSAIALKALLVAIAFGWVAIYSHLINPGETVGFYEDYAQRAVPWVALVSGAVLFFLTGRWLVRRVGAAASGTAAGVWIASVLLDVPILAANPPSDLGTVALCLVSWAVFAGCLAWAVRGAS